MNLKDVVILIFCVFLPPISIIIMAIDRNYKGTKLAGYIVLAILLTLLGWIPGMIFAFLMYFNVL